MTKIQSKSKSQTETPLMKKPANHKL